MRITQHQELASREVMIQVRIPVVIKGKYRLLRLNNTLHLANTAILKHSKDNNHNNSTSLRDTFRLHLLLVHHLWDHNRRFQDMRTASREETILNRDQDSNNLLIRGRD